MPVKLHITAGPGIEYKSQSSLSELETHLKSIGAKLQVTEAGNTQHLVVEVTPMGSVSIVEKTLRENYNIVVNRREIVVPE